MKNIFSTSLRHLCSHRVRLGVALGLALAGGCDPEEPIEARLCNRLDSCNFFGAGVSEGDCTDVMTMCSDGLVTSAKTDWERAANDSLEMANCVNFLAAYQEISVCSILTDGTIGTPGGGPGGTLPGGGDGPAPSCTEGQITCVGPTEIEVCDGGELMQLACQDVCTQQGYAGADDCSFDDESGHDVCWCIDTPAPPPGGPGGG